MILTDDNFASIEAAVEEGRTVYQNLLKAIAFTLPTNGGESLTILVGVLPGTPLPILPLQILWINMVSSIALTAPLAFEPKPQNVMHSPPRNPNEPLLSTASTQKEHLPGAGYKILTKAPVDFWASPRRWTQVCIAPEFHWRGLGARCQKTHSYQPTIFLPSTSPSVRSQRHCNRSHIHS